MEAIRLYTAPEVASILKVSTPEVYKLIERAELPVVRIGRCVRVLEDDLAEFVQRNRQPAPSAV